MLRSSLLLLSRAVSDFAAVTSNMMTITQRQRGIRSTNLVVLFLFLWVFLSLLLFTLNFATLRHNLWHSYAHDYHNLNHLHQTTEAQTPTNEILYAGAERSERLLLRAAQTPRSIHDDTIDSDVEAERCQRYNLEYKGRQTRRRVFYGSLIADDSWHPISISAIENYGIFHSVAFVESNRTQMLFPRDIRFGPSSDNIKVLQNGLFGPDTSVSVDYYVNENEWPKGLGREHHQRSMILNRWKANGMRADDIGYLADADETFTRDFIRAMQICEVREFDMHEHCKYARVKGSALVFEGGPHCVNPRKIEQPSLVIGECLDIIGDSSKHAPAQREWAPPGRTSWEGIAWLAHGYNAASDFNKLPQNTTHYPLLNAADFRRLGRAKSYDTHHYTHTSYHFHNFFPNVQMLRRKYKTYGHPVRQALVMPLVEIHPDVQLMIQCALNSTEGNVKYKLETNGLDIQTGELVPLAFQIPGYVEGFEGGRFE